MAFQKTEGEYRRDGAIALFEVHREVYVRRGRRALLTAMLAGNGMATADDVRDLVSLPNTIGPKLFGSVPTALAMAGIIARDGFCNTRRAEGHARPISVWRLIDRDAAKQWLATHPDLPDPIDDYPPAGTQRVLFDDQETAAPMAGTTGAAW